MIRFTLISRAGDALPLVATMESQQDENLIAAHKKMCKDIVRALTPDAGGPPPGATSRLSGDAASIVTDEYTFHYLVEAGIVFLTLTDKSYTRLLAFSYLTELQHAFFDDLRSSSRGNTPIHAVQRPYSFIRFEPTIQATKKRYINTRHLQAREDLQEMSLRVASHPQYKIADVMGEHYLGGGGATRFGFPVRLPQTVSSAIARVDAAAVSPNALSKTQARLLVGSALCTFVVDLIYLLLRWTSWFGSGGGADNVPPARIANLLVLLCGLSSPILVLVAFRFRNAAASSLPISVAPRLADAITAHALLTLLQLLWAAISRTPAPPPGKAAGAAATFGVAANHLARWSIPVPITIIKVIYVLLITIAVAAATINRWVGRWRDRKRGHRD
ncbi:SNAP receptor [Geranomyces variabilis]|uniref:Protein transport protein SEC22 n=1 Tax=Geranomyces variabilis TaxID=109894 RepID=A0AAD5TJ29_9FUNG|nr:SNAP receptor [Geranomyces variabilis]